MRWSIPLCRNVDIHLLHCLYLRREGGGRGSGGRGRGERSGIGGREGERSGWREGGGGRRERRKVIEIELV